MATGGAKTMTVIPSATVAINGHFLLHAINIMTKAIPQMIIPELKLFMVTRSARGPMRTAIIPHTRHSLICFPSLVMSTARSRITTIFTSSAGWKRRDLVPSHLFLPLTAIPSGVNVTRISQI